MKLRTVVLLTRSFGLFLCLAAALARRAVAQPASAAPMADEQPVRLEKFTVTGSHIPLTGTSEEASPFPTTVIERQSPAQMGSETTEEALQKFIFFNQGAVPVSNNDTGFTRDASGISLHGLGPDATLVLVNGHRVTPFPVGQFGDRAFANLNTTPLSTVDHFEVATDGASAIYGADAVAGVVNIILRRHVNGAEAHLSYYNTTNKDSSQVTASILSGISDDRGSLLVEFNYQKQHSVAYSDRDYSLVPPLLSSSSSPINAQITVTAYNLAVTGVASNSPRPPGVGSNIFFATPGITPGAAGGNTVSPNGLPVSPSTNFGSTPATQYIYSTGKQSFYDYNQSAVSFPDKKRYGVMLDGDHRLAGAPNLKGYFDADYQVSRTINQSAPAPTLNFQVPGLTPLVIPANTTTPLLFAVNSSGSLAAVKTAGSTFSAGQFAGPGTSMDASGHAQRLAVAGARNPFNPFNEDISGTSSYRLQEFGNRVYDNTTDAFLGTAGIRGENILDKYDVDAGFRYNSNTLRTNATQVSASKFNRILNANDSIFNPTSSDYIGTTTPYNPFGYYVNPIPANAAVVRYATIHVHDRNFASVGEGYLDLDTTKLFQLSSGDVGAAGGLDYRVETLNQAPDAETAAGDIIGEVQKLPVDRHRKVWAAYAELKIPIIGPQQHIPWVHGLLIDLAGRYEDFLTSREDKAVPKVGILYRPIDDSLSLHASASQGFLEPPMFKLYNGVFSLPSLVDPRNGKTLSEVPVRDIGNSGLKAETSNAYNAGIVWSPNFAPLRGFTTSVDLWRVERNGTALVNNQDTLNNYRNTSFGSVLNFNGPGNLAGETVLVDSSGNVNEVVSVYHNAGDTIAEGMDIAASYVRMTDWGKFDVAGMMGYLHSFKQASFPGQPLKELVDTSVDGAGQDAYLRRKAIATASWSHRGYAVDLTGHFIDGFQDYDVSGKPRRVGSSWTWDLRLSYTFDHRFGSYLRDTKVSVGSVNIFDRNPPVSIARGNSFSNYPGVIYNSLGRQIFISLDKNF